MSLRISKVPRQFSEERIVFNKWCWNNWIPTCKRTKLGSYFLPRIKTNSKPVKDLNVRAKTVKTQMKI